jgi:hypothetical protein
MKLRDAERNHVNDMIAMQKDGSEQVLSCDHVCVTCISSGT